MSANNKGKSIGSGLSSFTSYLVAKAKVGAGHAKQFGQGFVEGAKEGWNTSMEPKAKAEPKVELKPDQDEAKTVTIENVGTVKYKKADVDAIQAKMIKGEQLSKFDKLVLKAVLAQA